MIDCNHLTSAATCGTLRSFLIVLMVHMEKQNRQSNFEILRILSMLMIIAFHSVWHYKLFIGSCEFSANKLLNDILYYGGELGVNCFALISGYFLTTTNFKWKKLISMILQIYFYFYFCRIALIFFTTAPLDVYDFSSWFFPVLQGQYWFISAYIFAYILTPFLQKLIFAMNRREFEFLICSQFLIWSFFPTIFLTTVGKTTENMIFYNRYVWIIFLYLVGAYIKLYGNPFFYSARRSLAMFVATAAVLFLYIVLIEFFFNDTKSAIQFWGNNSLFQMVLSLSIFSFFQNLNIGCHPKINRIATTMLGVYLLHEGPFRNGIWHKVFVLVGHETDLFLFARILFAILFVMFAGVIVELCRQPFEKYIFNILRRINTEFKNKKNF